jgi:hypothetical protein
VRTHCLLFLDARRLSFPVRYKRNTIIDRRNPSVALGCYLAASRLAVTTTRPLVPFSRRRPTIAQLEASVGAAASVFD